MTNHFSHCNCITVINEADLPIRITKNRENCTIDSHCFFWIAEMG